MARVLVLFAHPALEKSRVNRRLLKALPKLPGLTFHDLYEHCPSFHLNVAYEQELLTNHDTIIMQHPLYWYSVPPLLKQWMDLVLEHGWAYGLRGEALRGKQVFQIITVGGPASSYMHEGFQKHTLRDFLLPIEQTARLCRMDYLAPYVIYGTHRLNEDDLVREAVAYRRLLEWVHNNQLPFDGSATQSYATMNEAMSTLAPEVLV
ncbi:NAD(P)H-dependent oxidoreductase [Candidatus Chloroploca sp. Khr17]|uniref:NAD(P)H-dependent oxidoreductase n=1 Tax=Candidatus Chloroploca sp. Khr17 TaxID=2496869 RepID=UPI00101CC1C8|nr:NAD(P)H-dependent oxidoreductase [Candidatus Chloroploca sp. Khr17]